MSKESFRKHHPDPWWISVTCRGIDLLTSVNPTVHLAILGAFVIGASSLRAQTWTDQEIRQFSPAGLTPDKIGRFIDETDPETDVSIKWNRFAIFDPKTALDAREKQKNPEFKARERFAIQAITQAPEFLQLKQEAESKKEPKQRMQEDAARLQAKFAIEKPFEAAKDAEKTKDAATKRREQIAAEAILKPREFNAQVDRLKTPELKAREAEVWRAFTQPKVFLEERTRLKKTGQAFPPKQAADAPKGRGQGQGQDNKVNGPASAQGGAR